jgi:hypothetical protein
MASLPHRAQRARQARRLAALTAMARREVRHRESLRDKATAAAAIRAVLAACGIDGGQAPGVRYFADAERQLVRLGDTAEMRRADAEFIALDPELAGRKSLAAQAAERAPRFAGQPPPDPGAAPFDWYAGALAAADPASASRKPLASR